MDIKIVGGRKRISLLNVPIDIVTSSKKIINIEKHYNTDRLRPFYKSFEFNPLFIMTDD